MANNRLGDTWQWDVQRDMYVCKCGVAVSGAYLVSIDGSDLNKLRNEHERCKTVKTHSVVVIFDDQDIMEFSFMDGNWIQRQSAAVATMDGAIDMIDIQLTYRQGLPPPFKELLDG